METSGRKGGRPDPGRSGAAARGRAASEAGDDPSQSLQTPQRHLRSDGGGPPSSRAAGVTAGKSRIGRAVIATPAHRSSSIAGAAGTPGADSGSGASGSSRSSMQQSGRVSPDPSQSSQQSAAAAGASVSDARHTQAGPPAAGRTKPKQTASRHATRRCIGREIHPAPLGVKGFRPAAASRTLPGEGKKPLAKAWGRPYPLPAHRPNTRG